jgi:hypothetical protein
MITSLNSINQLIFVMGKCCVFIAVRTEFLVVFFAVRTEFLNII